MDVTETERLLFSLYCNIESLTNTIYKDYRYIINTYVKRVKEPNGAFSSFSKSARKLLSRFSFIIFECGHTKSSSWLLSKSILLK